jgi:hypothetical protein
MIRMWSTPSGRGVARLQVDVRKRVATDLYAMEAAKRYFAEVGWRVRDVSGNSSYDLLCERQGHELHVGVKGTTGATRVSLTPNEVTHALINKPRVALFVLAEIEIREVDGGEVACLAVNS